MSTWWRIRLPSWVPQDFLVDQVNLGDENEQNLYFEWQKSCSCVIDLVIVTDFKIYTSRIRRIKCIHAFVKDQL